MFLKHTNSSWQIQFFKMRKLKIITLKAKRKSRGRSPLDNKAGFRSYSFNIENTVFKSLIFFSIIKSQHRHYLLCSKGLKAFWCIEWMNHWISLSLVNNLSIRYRVSFQVSVNYYLRVLLCVKCCSITHFQHIYY